MLSKLSLITGRIKTRLLCKVYRTPWEPAQPNIPLSSSPLFFWFLKHITFLASYRWRLRTISPSFPPSLTSFLPCTCMDVSFYMLLWSLTRVGFFFFLLSARFLKVVWITGVKYGNYISERSCLLRFRLALGLHSNHRASLTQCPAGDLTCLSCCGTLRWTDPRVCFPLSLVMVDTFLIKCIWSSELWHNLLLLYKLFFKKKTG